MSVEEKKFYCKVLRCPLRSTKRKPIAPPFRSAQEAAAHMTSAHPNHVLCHDCQRYVVGRTMSRHRRLCQPLSFNGTANAKADRDAQDDDDFVFADWVRFCAPIRRFCFFFFIFNSFMIFF